MNGRETGTLGELQSARMAASAASCSRTRARWSAERSIPCASRKPRARCSTRAPSSDSPPAPCCRCEAATSHTQPPPPPSAPSGRLASTVREEESPLISSTASVPADASSSGNSSSAARAAATADGTSSSRCTPARRATAAIAARKGSSTGAGTPATATVTLRPATRSADSLRAASVRAASSAGGCSTPCTLTAARPCLSGTTSNGVALVAASSASVSRDSNARPSSSWWPYTAVARDEKRSFLAVRPTSASPSSANATTDGVTRPPFSFSTTRGAPPSKMAAQAPDQSLEPSPREQPIASVVKYEGCSAVRRGADSPLSVRLRDGSGSRSGSPSGEPSPPPPLRIAS
mmetsp:Transcript_27113/g.87030  ORF Transcript_27113/g.87030 Transcript_27113/m.87030 type:complete len:348 (-) Transcript_27113:208-1251(-)